MSHTLSAATTLDLDFSKCTVVHHLDSHCAITSIGRKLKYRSSTGDYKNITLPFKFPRDLSFGFRYLERFLRSDKCLAVPHHGSVIIIRGSTVYRWKDNLEVLGKIQGDCPLHASAAIGQSGSLYFGEYFSNPKRTSVNIFKIDSKTQTLVTAHTFAAEKFATCTVFIVILICHNVCGLQWATTTANASFIGPTMNFYHSLEWAMVHKLGEQSVLCSHRRK
jgi:hypothetical protein